MWNGYFLKIYWKYKRIIFLCYQIKNLKSLSLKVIKNNETIVPFFSERMNFIRGLDPLGLQNTSDSTFSILLPGLNNVTGRIRYYSFYCWLLDEYSKRVGSTNPNEQKKFIRTAEFIIALSSQFYTGDNGSIPGSNYAKLEIQNKEIDFYDLNAGIYKPDGTTANTYWNFGWGAFGQYYLGSMRDIGIIINRDDEGDIYTRTNSRLDGLVSGEMLSKSFALNIHPEKSDIFFESISNGKINEFQLKYLLPDFNLSKVPSGSEEETHLIQLLLQKDYPLRIEENPSELRKKTISHLLKFSDSKPFAFNDREFVYMAYENKGIIEGKVEESLFGWYYYQFNEFWQYANTSILNGVLDYLESFYGPNWIPLSQLVDEITELVIDEFKNGNLVRDSDDWVSGVLSRLDINEHDLFQKTLKSKRTEKVFYGFLLIFSQCLKNNDELVSLKEYGDKNDLGKDGEGPGYFLTQFKVKLSLSITDFVKEYVFKKIIYRHQYVAFRKIRGGGFSTQKFVIEDHHIRYLGNFEATYTGPRIGNLISFLKDLNILSPDNQLTEKGSSVLNQISLND